MIQSWCKNLESGNRCGYNCLNGNCRSKRQNGLQGPVEIEPYDESCRLSVEGELKLNRSSGDKLIHL